VIVWRELILALLLVIALCLGEAQTEAAPHATSWHTRIAPEGEKWRHYYRRNGDHWRRHYRSPDSSQSVRPLSCGEFRFWDGTRCVDVRFR